MSNSPLSTSDTGESNTGDSPPSNSPPSNSHTAPASMTAAISPRRALLVILAVISLTSVYLVGATRSTGMTAAASTGTINTSPTQPSTIAGVGGPGITMSGRADVAGTPDTLRLDLSVVATASSVSEALAKANGSANAVQKSLLGSGVAKKDLQTSGLNIAPSYDYANPGAPRLTGFEVSESLSAKLRDLGRAGDAIGKAVGAGGNAVRVNGVSLDLEDTGVLVSQARGSAFADARNKAEQYAKAAGRSLGDVVSIAESVANPSPITVPSAAMATKQADVPIQPGSQEVSVTVTVVFAMS
jgi:uncharacterized protein YggE